MTKSTRILYTRNRSDIPPCPGSTYEDVPIKGGVQTVPVSDTANICDVSFFSGEDSDELLEDSVDYQITDDSIEILGVQDERGLSMMVLARSTSEDNSKNDDDEDAAGSGADDADSTVDD